MVDVRQIVIFNHKTFHGAFGGTRRRMFCLNCTRRAHTEEELSILDRYLVSHSPESSGRRIGGMFSPTMWRTATPGRVRHLEQIQERHAVVWPAEAKL